MGSENRKRDKVYPVRLSQDELDRLRNKLALTGVSSVADLMRRATLGYPIADRHSERMFIELMRLKGDIGRLGGLFKLYINHTDDSKIDADNLATDFAKLHQELKAFVEEIKV